MSQTSPLGMSRDHDPNGHLSICRGLGSTVWDTEGNEYLDFISGYSANNLGHCHPRLVSAASEQIGQLSFVTGGASPWREQLQDRLTELYCRSAGETTSHTRTGTVQVWISTTGARAVEIAWKIAVAARPGGVVRFDLSYHGRSIATAAISDTARSEVSNAFRDSGPWNAGDHVIPFPRCEDFRKCEESLCTICTDSLNAAQRLFETRANELSVLFLEPAIGARGYFFASSEYFRRLVQAARRHGILIASDEVQMGLGRLGPLFVSVSDGWEPDLLILGKSLGGGIVPISAVVAHESLMQHLAPGLESETFAAMPLACRVAIESLESLEECVRHGGVCETGELFRQSLRAEFESESRVHVDGCGLATVLDLSAFSKDSQRRCWSWVTELRELGVLVHLTGPERNRIAIIPPINVERELLLSSVEKFRSAWNALQP